MAKSTGWLHETTLRLTRVHFAYITIYAMAIVIFDSWNLITAYAVGRRWTAAAIMLTITCFLWYAVRLTQLGAKRYYGIFAALLAADIVFAGWNVYTQRGMASKAVMLFAVPIVSAALLRSRSTILAVATLCTAAYSLALVRYFTAHYGEGFRIELYGETFFYSAMFYVLAWLLIIWIEPRRT